MDRRFWLLIENIDDPGGVRKFVLDMARRAKRLRFDLQVISRFQLAGANRDDIQDVSFNCLYEAQFSSLVQEQKSYSRGSSEWNSIEAKLRIMKSAARSNLRQIVDAWGGSDLVVAAQAGSLLELLDLENENVARPFSLYFQFHGTYSYAVQQNYWKRLSQALSQVDGIIVLSKQDGIDFENICQVRTYTIPNAIDIPTSVQDFTQRKNAVVYIGRLVQEKTVNELIEAWNLLPSYLSGKWELQIFGTGDKADDLKLLASRMELSNVYFHGFTDDPIKVLQGARIHAMTSHKEGMPMAILEANAVGTPTISYDASPGVRDLVIDGDNGRLVPTGEVTVWKERLSEMMRDTQMLEKMSASARQLSESFSTVAIDAKWRLFLDNCKENWNTVQINNSQQGKSSATSDYLEYELLLVDSSQDVTLIFETDNKIYGNKPFVITVQQVGENRGENVRHDVSLPWSSILNAPYCYFPDTDTSHKYISIPLSFTRPVNSFSIRIERWGVKKFDPARSLRQVYVRTGNTDSENPSIRGTISRGFKK